MKVQIDIYQEDMGFTVYVNKKLHHEHNDRSIQAVNKWIDIIEEFFNTTVNIHEEPLDWM